ncbi:MAG: hypothetical protein WKF97_03080 [Chitinophagaceae bacterium]
MVTLDEDNKKVHCSQIDYTTFAKTKRFNKGADIERSYEITSFSHYIPGYKFDEETGSGNHFYNRKEFNPSSSSSAL